MHWLSGRRRTAAASRLPRMVALVSLIAVSACGGDSTAPVTTGNLFLSTNTLPPELSPRFTISGPENESRTVGAYDTIRNLQPGSITIIPGDVSANGVGRFSPTFVQYVVNIRIGETSRQTVPFAPAPAVLIAQVTGLPESAQPMVRFTAPDQRWFAATANVPFTTPIVGSWIIRGEPVSADNFLWTPQLAELTSIVLPGDTARLTLPYEVSSGAILVQPTGLSTELTPTITVTNGVKTTSRAGPGIIPDLEPGNWQVSATSGTVSGVRYSPVISTVDVTVSLGAVAQATIPYASEVIRTNFSVERAYLSQSVQLPDGSVPLVAGRDALLRVFARANEPNSWRPLARVQLFRNNSLFATLNATYGGSGIDTVVNEGVPSGSWNLRIPGALVVPGLRFRVEVDPERSITDDEDPDDNSWPRDGSAQPVTVQELQPWRVVLVPVENTASSLTGDVSASNTEAFISVARQLLPVDSVDVRVRETFTSGVPVLQSNDGNNAWTQLLSELNAARVAEGRSGEYWYGVVKVDYRSGIAGYGYVPGRTGVGWDYLPGGARVAAHEWGHNMSRRHAPCGNVGNADGAFPFSGGVIGSWGWNSATNALISPSATDLMGYCGNQWISSYNWTAMLNYRRNTNALVAPASSAASGNAAGDRLLVWGTLSAQGVQVEPTFLLTAAGSGDNVGVDDPVLDATRAVRIEALAANGQVLASKIANASEIDHVTDGTRSFAATLTLSAEQQTQLHSVRVRDVRATSVQGSRQRSVEAAVASAQGTRAPTVLTSSRTGAAQVQLNWNSNAYPRAMLRSASTGRIIGFLNSATNTFTWRGGDVDVVLSDGVRSRVERMTPP